MNFNIFVLICTVIFYIVLRMYKKNVNEKRNGKSNLLYVLFLPLVMYLCHFMYSSPSTIESTNKIIPTPTQIPVGIRENSIFDSIKSSESLLTSPFPESSVSISTSSSK